jgi:pimeloyl-ACP methyl ester carboxylesterase
MALPTLLVVDALAGLAYRTGTTANVTIIRPRSGTTHRAIVLFPGYVMPGNTLARAFAPFVGDNDALVGIDYAERGVNAAQISDQALAAVQTLRPRELVVYGASMGGMVGKIFLDRYRQRGAAYGKATLVLDSAPATSTNIKRSSVFFDVSCWYRGGPVSSALWAWISDLAAKPPVEKDADPSIVRNARQAGAWAGMPALTSQACFIKNFSPLKEGELADITDRVIYLQPNHPNDDPLVRISDAIAGWRVAFPNLMVVPIEGRKGRWHMPLVEYPRETVEAMLSSIGS